jgi:hypothetical protein
VLDASWNHGNVTGINHAPLGGNAGFALSFDHPHDLLVRMRMCRSVRTRLDVPDTIMHFSPESTRRVILSVIFSSGIAAKDPKPVSVAIGFPPVAHPALPSGGGHYNLSSVEPDNRVRDFGSVARNFKDPTAAPADLVTLFGEIDADQDGALTRSR